MCGRVRVRSHTTHGQACITLKLKHVSLFAQQKPVFHSEFFLVVPSNQGFLIGHKLVKKFDSLASLTSAESSLHLQSESVSSNCRVDCN